MLYTLYALFPVLCPSFQRSHLQFTCSLPFFNCLSPVSVFVLCVTLLSPFFSVVLIQQTILYWLLAWFPSLCIPPASPGVAVGKHQERSTHPPRLLQIVFKNMASRPYSIYPQGLTIDKSQEGVNYPEGGTDVLSLRNKLIRNVLGYSYLMGKRMMEFFLMGLLGGQSHGVRPGETHTYVWKVLEKDEPLDGDSRCLTRMYHSAVDTPHDIASGLIGPILICKSQSLNVRNVQVNKKFRIFCPVKVLHVKEEPLNSTLSIFLNRCLKFWKSVY